MPFTGQIYVGIPVTSVWDESSSNSGKFALLNEKGNRFFRFAQATRRKLVGVTR